MAMNRGNQPTGISVADTFPKQKKKKSSNLGRRRLQIENLEDRRVMAGPNLAGITVNDTTLLETNAIREISPKTLTFTFDKGQVIDATTISNGIKIVRSGHDGTFGNANDVTIVPGFLGIGNSTNEVVMRFAENLPDDTYQISIIGRGEDPLRNTLGQAFNDGVDTVRQFRLNLAPQIIAVVPQPITRNRTTGTLTQARNQVIVYFNNDNLDSSLANNPQFYQLIPTGHTDQFDDNFLTVSNTDDGAPIRPISAAYSDVTDSVTLTFADDISKLAVGTLRLRIGDSSTAPNAPSSVDVTDDPGSSFSGASAVIGSIFNRTVVINSAIDAQASPIIFPGSNQDPGHRQVSSAFDKHVPDSGFDVTSGITRIAYNFDTIYGQAPNGTLLRNTITEAQRQRAREAFELWATYLGVKFVETPTEGFTIATGDLRAIDPDAITDPDVIQGASGNIPNFGPTAVMNAGQRWNEDFGGNWFQEAMRQIGSLLGLGAAGDLPIGTIMGGNPEVSFGNAPLGVFPGNHDIVHGQYLFRPDSNDIDMYRVVLPQAGQLRVETIAERLANSSLLDTAIRVYRQVGNSFELVAQNDDYFSQDSQIVLDLQPGTYFIGVSSKGNESYDPTIANTGSGGISQGNYQLRVEVRGANSNVIRDSSGIALDGDGDGDAGGNYNFWFRSQPESKTRYVDKATAVNGTGTLTSPFKTVQAAMQAAQPGDIVRVVGNNLATTSLTDDLPYEIGVNKDGVPLADGGENGLLDIKQGVTLMLDAGAILKLRRGAITVGSTSIVSSRAGAALQVLGTPTNSVYFTSYNDTVVGADVNPLFDPARKGDWGGILFRNDVEAAAGRFNYEEQGIFLNYVNHADMRFGGGVLSLNSLTGVLNPITMIEARPTVTYNFISQSADAAMSASPNSFVETSFNDPLFQSTPFTAEYGRVGPDIHGNTLISNTTNGIFIANPFTTSPQGDALTQNARWDDADIVHVVAEGLRIAGTPGGPTGTDSLNRTGRRDASLVIDPGIVVKLEGAQIEVGMGANLLAEGTADRPIIITSLLDDRFGAGGTFDTNGDGAANAPQAGDWAGLYLAPGSQGSFDYNTIAYGGGVAPIEGSFTAFNAIEAHQADLRVVHSRLESNASGVGGAAPITRFGRTENGRGAIFVAGSQPVIVDNSFLNNDSAAIYIDVNSLNFAYLVDPGRSTGSLGRIAGFGDNQGPLVRRNSLTNNTLNGMEVRGGTLTTQSVWDDTDVVHIVRSGIFIPNFHTYGGLQLKSTPNQSLVVKLSGDSAGFITTGSAVGVPDHIGGAVQVIGQPGKPVVMTSLFDDTVGAGFDNLGITQTDTDNGKRPFSGNVDDGFKIDINFGPRASLSQEVKDAVRKAANAWEEELSDDMTLIIDVELEALGGGILNGLDIDRFAQLFNTSAELVPANFDTVRNALIADASQGEEIVSQLPTYAQFNFVLPDLATSEFDVSQTMALTRANAKALGIPPAGGSTSLYDPQEIRDGQININDNLDIFDFDRKNGLQSYREDFESAMYRQIGRILGFRSGVDVVGAGLRQGFTTDVQLSPLDLFRFAPGQGGTNFTSAPRMLDPRFEAHVFYAGEDPTLDYRNYPLQGLRLGEIPMGTGYGDVRGEGNDSYGAAFWRDDLTFKNNKLDEKPPIGAMDPSSRLRDNVFYELDPWQTTRGLIQNITEADRRAFGVIGYDVVGGTSGDWLGIEVQRLSHDGNVAVVPELETPNSPPGTNSTPAKAQFLGQLAPNEKSGDENVRLGFEVVGLISQPSDVDVYSFQGIAGTPIWLDIDRTSSSLDTILELISPDGALLAQSNNSLAESADPTQIVGIGQPFVERDTYTTNTYDAGMRLVLPGTAGAQGTYHVRVRSNGLALSNITGGQTQGNYQLQVRLQAEDEVPGVSVELADIRYASTGIRIIGPPSRSPLQGEQTEDSSLNDTFSERQVLLVDDMGMPADPPEFIEMLDLPYTVDPQFLGNLLTSRQGVQSVFGKLSQASDVDWYRFEVSYNDLILPLEAGANIRPVPVGVVFDIDYADGLGRPDMNMAVFDSTGRLIFYSSGSNVAADQPATDGTPAAFDLSRGSFGTGDPFIGPVVLDAVRDAGALDDAPVGTFQPGNYFVAVSSARQQPRALSDGSAPQSNILGLPGRGQRVDGTIPLDTLFVTNPLAPVGGTYAGEYQLEIRSVPIPEGGFNPSNATIGDSNRKREQGQISISSNQIRNSREWGIVVEDGLRDLPLYRGDFLSEIFGSTLEGFSQEFYKSIDHNQFSGGDYVPYPGAPRALPNLNQERLIPGITIENNLITGGREGGLQMQGDPNGVVISTYNLSTMGEDLKDFSIDGQEFTLWDHNRNTIQFTFNGADAGELEIRVNTNVDDDTGAFPTTFVSTSGAPTLAQTVADEIEHAIRLSGLDVKVYRGSDDTLFVEGAVEIGHPDIVDDDSIWNVLRPGDKPGDALYPYITTHFVQQGAVPYARVVNNTLVGRGGSLLAGELGRGVSDIGISIEDNASPTLLNNIIANFAVGISTDLSSTDNRLTERRTFVGGGTIDQDNFGIGRAFQTRYDDGNIPLRIRLLELGHGLGFIQDEFLEIGEFNRNFLDYDSSPTDYVGFRPTVVGGTVFQGNRQNKIGIANDARESFEIVLNNSDPLFVDPENGNYFLAANSKAIDSSIDLLTERTAVLEVMQAVGIDSKGISAPSTDVRGILRVDDPGVEPPTGIGRNVFKDRGALERADFTGPVAELLNPVDNDLAGADRDPTSNVVAIFQQSFASFDIRINDQARVSDPIAGVGADDSTVTAAAIKVSRDGNLLTIDTDYVLTYDFTNDTIRLTSTSGVWQGGTYLIELDNTLIKDLSNNPLQANGVIDGKAVTRFQITLGEGFDYGDAPSSFKTLASDDGPRHRSSGLFLGGGVDLEADGKPSQAADRDGNDDGVTFTTEVAPGNDVFIEVVASLPGILNAWIDLNGNSVFDATDRIFTNRSLTAGLNRLGPVQIPRDVATGLRYARFRFGSESGLGPTGLAQDGEVEDYAIRIGASIWQNPADRFNVNNDPGGIVGPIDALQVINELTDHDFSDPNTGRLNSTKRPEDPFYDVNGDGFVSPIDALQVINQLSSSSRAASGIVVTSDDETVRLASVQLAGLGFAGPDGSLLRNESHRQKSLDTVFGDDLRTTTNVSRRKLALDRVWSASESLVEQLAEDVHSAWHQQ